MNRIYGVDITLQHPVNVFSPAYLAVFVDSRLYKLFANYVRHRVIKWTRSVFVVVVFFWFADFAL